MTTLALIDQIIAAKKEQLRLLGDLRLQVEFIERAGLRYQDVERTGYDANKDERLTRWTATEQDRIGLPRVLNYAILKDGTRVDVPIDWQTPRDEYRASVRKGTDRKLYPPRAQ
jgi:hypothetical protein